MTAALRAQLQEYATAVAETDVLEANELQPVLLGLFGEVGSIMAAAKKLHRENRAFLGYRQAVVEEFGDALWYFAAICRRKTVNFESAFGSELEAREQQILPFSPPLQIAAIPQLDPMLRRLGEDAAALLAINDSAVDARPALSSFAASFFKALHVTGITLGEVIRFNILKTRGRFVDPNPTELPTFDDEYNEDERLPAYFEITIKERSSGLIHMQWNGVFIGDPLSDNILDKDGYRFHDVFHFAYAAILHWSPTIRALIKQKRKSNKAIDEAEDGGRAAVVEEGLTAWIFSRAKELEFFENQERLSFDMLKTIQQFVSGYEVSRCPLRLWERAILDGYAVFRRVRQANGGVVVGNRAARSIEYRPLPGAVA